MAEKTVPAPAPAPTVAAAAAYSPTIDPMAMTALIGSLLSP